MTMRDNPVMIRLRTFGTTIALLAAIAAMAAGAGYLLAGELGALMAVGLALVSGVGGSRYADRYVLRAVGARPLSPFEAPAVHNAVRELTLRASLPMPRLWVFPSAQPNAFTVGRDPEHASIALSAALLQRLDGRGLAGVLAHEIAHIRHHDILLASFAATVTQMLRSVGRALGLFVFLAFPALLLFAPKMLVLWAMFTIAPIAALLLQNALSRQREFAADAEAARLTGDPIGLANALQQLEQANRPLLARLLGFTPRGGTPLHSHPSPADRVVRLSRMQTAPQPYEAPRVEPIRSGPAQAASPIRVIPGHRAVPGRRRRPRVHVWRFVG